jgi:hydroxymethylpyrimidine/phosphomethylpyrimidine kinase
VRAQIAAAFATAHVDAIKIGMLATAATVQAVATSLPADCPPIVLDPVLMSSSGGQLLDRGGQEALRTVLLPRATVLTPNIPEAAALLGTHCAQGEQDLLYQAAALRALGAAAVLLKGGHAEEPEATDLLLTADATAHWLRAPRINVERRGTGCALSSAIAAGLGAGLDIVVACTRAKQHVAQLLQQGD